MGSPQDPARRHRIKARHTAKLIRWRNAKELAAAPAAVAAPAAPAASPAAAPKK